MRRMVRIGSHVEIANPQEGARLRAAEVVQVNLSAPRNWKAPLDRKEGASLRGWSVPIYVHAPYLLNPASGERELRAKTALALQQQLAAAEKIGAKGLVVHGGHSKEGGAQAVQGWLEMLERVSSSVPVLIENTAGGAHAAARSIEDVESLWRELEGENFNVGFCFDTCHAWAAGFEITEAFEEILAITGGVALVHLNDSKDPRGSRRDRHEALGKGLIGEEALKKLVQAAYTAGVDMLVETPGGWAGQAEDVKLARSWV